MKAILSQFAMKTNASLFLYKFDKIFFISFIIFILTLMILILNIYFICLLFLLQFENGEWIWTLPVWRR